MTTDNSTIKAGDSVKVVDADHYAAGNVGVVKSVTKDIHKVEVTLANGVVETIDFVKDQLGGIEEDVVQGLGLVKASPSANAISEPKAATVPDTTTGTSTGTVSS